MTILKMEAAGEAARSGPVQLFFLVAVISLQVGILNLFPLAPLDGGHMAVIAAEGLIRRDLSLKFDTQYVDDADVPPQAIQLKREGGGANNAASSTTHDRLQMGDSGCQRAIKRSTNAPMPWKRST